MTKPTRKKAPEVATESSDTKKPVTKPAANSRTRKPAATKAKATTTPVAKSRTRKPAATRASTTAAPAAKSRTRKPVTTKARTTATSKIVVGEVDKLKLQVRQLRKDLKASQAQNETLKQEVETLNKKNASLMRRRAAGNPRAKSAAKKDESNEQTWVDKWWESF
ncbi:hypothetical protein [Leucothrix arctica]|uniref:Uncharacterized protein n=1 Tax=Leucothrix arctica TaxID=1481894 RepID=A0A317CML0_9GAMM|nr:hypothetical protein [Leucothrix arctica]PWQ97550.1 hypothetical protein DKT75_06420 [Leucothrix arctica]